MVSLAIVFHSSSMIITLYPGVERIFALNVFMIHRTASEKDVLSCICESLVISKTENLLVMKSFGFLLNDRKPNGPSMQCHALLEACHQGRI